MNIKVKINNRTYMWVDTVVMRDEIDRPIAILVDRNTGAVFERDVCTLKVVDPTVIKTI